MDEDEPKKLDGRDLIRAVRKGDPAALQQAYRLTFASEMGRLVLASFMADCGVGNALGTAENDLQLRYRAGRHDAALELASRAGFDQAAIAVAVLSDELEETTDDRTDFAADGQQFLSEY